MTGSKARLRIVDPAGESPPRKAVRAKLSISILGTISIRYDGREVNIRNRKSRAVLAYVALSESSQETRERLVGLFWSESEEQRARASLRQTIRELKRCFLEVGYDGLQAGKLAIELDRDSLDVDLWAVQREAQAHRAHPLLTETPRLPDQLLQNFDDVDPAFHVWVLAKRQTIHDRLVRALEDGLRSETVDRRTAKQLAEALVSLDPTHEEACRSLMKARAEEGDVSAALRVYKTLWNLLDDEYGMEPSARTQQLVAEIKQGLVERETSATIHRFHGVEESGAAAPRPSARIAILCNPFGMDSVGPDRTHLVRGFRHHLIAYLVRFREWTVVDNVASSVRPGTPSTAAQYGIDATAYQAGDTLNLVLTLRDENTGSYVWSETFELKLESWFEAQQRIVRRIAISLNVQLSAERLMRLAGEPAIALDTYDRWLRGQAAITSFSPDKWNAAERMFIDTIRDAPGFSPAYSSLVQLNNTIHFVHPGIFRDPRKARETLELARTAVQLDAVDSRAQLSLGWAYAMSKQYAQAEVHMELARELNENDAWTLTSTALFNAFCGKLDRARRLAGEALELSLAPLPLQWAYLAMIRFMCAEYDGALQAVDRANDVIKTMPAWRAATLFHLGSRDEAASEGRRFVSVVHDRWFGEMPATDEAIGRWFLHCHPISEREHWERLRDGVRGAGIPAVGIDHHGW